MIKRNKNESNGFIFFKGEFMKKKYIIKFILLIIIIISLVLFFNRKKDYSIKYDFKNYSIKETYNKKENTYYFNVSKDDYSFDFVSDNIKTKNKRIVKNINNVEVDNYYCIDLDVEGYYFNSQCTKENKYYDYGLVSKEEKEEDKKYSVGNIDIYNKKYHYYVWNGYGITDLKDNKKINFLKNESYDNPFSYRLGKYIIFGDYDAKREYEKLYIFDNKSNKISELKLDYSLSKNSYFLGDYDNLVYIFDKKNKIEYSLNIDKEKMEIVSDNDGGKFLDKDWTYYTLNKLSYNEYSFKYNNIVNYQLINNKLYYSYKDSKNNILISNDDISSIAYIDDDYKDDIFYLKQDSLYKYSIKNGEEKIAQCFEWNFSTRNKIFIF